MGKRSGDAVVVCHRNRHRAADMRRRIGRQRTAYLGLSGASISATEALRWGLIDHVR